MRLIHRALAVAACSLTCAQAQVMECLNATTTEATGYGVTGQTSDEQVEQALASALASAITQVRGVYIASSTELVEVIKESTSESDYSVTSSTELREEVTERFSGFVTRYDLLERTTGADGLAAVSIRAEVCLDPRIVLAFQPSDALAIFAGGLASNVGSLGWKVVSTSSGTSGSLLELSLQTGASYIAQGHLQVTPMSASDRATSYMASLDVSLIDVRSLEVVSTLTLTENGIGYTDAEAIQDATTKLANAVARDWTRQFLAPEQRQASSIVVSGISRSGSRYTLEEMVQDLPGVIGVTSTTYDEAARAVTLEVELSADLCSVAEGLTQERRIMMQVEMCDPARAELKATRE